MVSRCRPAKQKLAARLLYMDMAVAVQQNGSPFKHPKVDNVETSAFV